MTARNIILTCTMLGMVASAQARPFIRGTSAHCGAIVAVVRADDPPKAETEYYPLKEGSTWTYKVADKTMTVTLTKFETVKNLNCAVLETRDADKKLVASEKVTVKADGVYRVMFADQQAEPELKFLQLPAKAPASWEFKSKIANQDVAGKFATTEEPNPVTVPFGKFEKVLKVASSGVKVGDQDTTITYWFAPKVGMIKQEVAIGGVNITLELQKYDEKK